MPSSPPDRISIKGFSFQVSLYRSLFRECIGNGVVFAGDVPEANLHILSRLLNGDLRIELQEQIQIGGYGAAVGTKAVFLTPTRRISLLTRSMQQRVVQVHYLPASKPFRHAIHHILRIRSNDPRLLRFPRPATIRALPHNNFPVIQSIGLHQILQRRQRGQQFRPLAGALLSRVPRRRDWYGELARRLFATGDPDTGRGSDLAVETAGTI